MIIISNFAALQQIGEQNKSAIDMISNILKNIKGGK